MTNKLFIVSRLPNLVRLPPDYAQRQDAQHEEHRIEGDSGDGGDDGSRRLAKIYGKARGLEHLAVRDDPLRLELVPLPHDGLPMRRDPAIRLDFVSEVVPITHQHEAPSYHLGK